MTLWGRVSLLTPYIMSVAYSGAAATFDGWYSAYEVRDGFLHLSFKARCQ